MSKRRREERRQQAVLKSGTSDAPAPERPKEHLLRRQPGADTRVEDQRAVWLTRQELTGLIKIVEHHSTQHRLLPYLKQILERFDDAVQHIKDLEKTAIALGFWMEGEQANLNRLIGKPRGNRRKGHRKLEDGIACPSPQEMRRLLQEREDECRLNGTGVKGSGENGVPSPTPSSPES